MTKTTLYSLIIVLSFLFFACGEEVYTPKPAGYYRIALPEHHYNLFDTVYPYRFEYADIAQVVTVNNKYNEPYWINIVYPDYNATIYVSYKKVHGNMDTLIKDSRTFVSGQIQKAEDIIEYHVIDSINNVYGMAYQILGTEVACPYQFWLTDKKSHYFRAALYFNHTPNNDSLTPVLNHIEKDLLHLIDSFRWRD